MKKLACISGLAAALCLLIPATASAHDFHGGWHGRAFCGPRFFGFGAFPFVAAYPYYAYAYAGGPYYDAYYASPSVGVSVSTPPYGTYRGTRADDHSDDLTVDVQRALRRDGYYRGSIDGDIGSGTRAAIRQYQYDHHLEVTGRIDRALVHSLELD